MRVFKLVAFLVFGLLGSDAGSIDFRRLNLGRHALDLVINGTALVRKVLDCDPMFVEPLCADSFGFPVQFVCHSFDLGQRSHLDMCIKQSIVVFVRFREVVRILAGQVRSEYAPGRLKVSLDREFIGGLHERNLVTDLAANNVCHESFTFYLKDSLARGGHRGLVLNH